MMRYLILAGIVLLVIGLAWPLLQRLGLGRLPGDVSVRGERWSFRLPLMTCLVISVLVTVVIFLLRRVRW